MPAQISGPRALLPLTVGVLVPSKLARWKGPRFERERGVTTAGSPLSGRPERLGAAQRSELGGQGLLQGGQVWEEKERLTLGHGHAESDRLGVVLVGRHRPRARHGGVTDARPTRLQDQGRLSRNLEGSGESCTAAESTHGLRRPAGRVLRLALGERLPDHRSGANAPRLHPALHHPSRSRHAHERPAVLCEVNRGVRARGTHPRYLRRVLGGLAAQARLRL